MGDPATIGLIVAGVGTAASLVQGQQAAKEREKEAKAQQGIAAIRNRRERARMLTQAAIRQANVENQAAAQGATGSSGFQGFTAATTTQAASAMGDFNASEVAANQMARAQTAGARATGRANLFQTAASLGMYGFEQFGGFRTVLGPGANAGNTIQTGATLPQMPSSGGMLGPQFTYPSVTTKPSVFN